jgi:hypothetical protein
MDPTRMTAQAIVALASDLEALEASRRQPARMAG